jgi:hypothetical protein
VIVRRSPDGQVSDCTPASFNVRTRVHEYGGNCYVVSSGTLWFSNFGDQRLYRQDRGTAPRAITPEADLRYADGVLDLQRGRLVCVREDHTGSGQPVNSIVSVDLEGGAPARAPPTTLCGPTPVAGRTPPGLAGVEPSQHALGRPSSGWEAGPCRRRHPQGAQVGWRSSSSEWSPDGVLYFVSTGGW